MPPATAATLTLAVLGTRGVPARYGGFETFAEQISARLARRGHEVTVYRRSRYAEGDLPGVQIVTLPALYTKHLETVSHGLLSALHCAGRRPDAALVCNAANAPFLPLLSAAGIATAINVDGIEWQRRKWHALGRAGHRLAEHLAVGLADAVVADAQVIREYYRRAHRQATELIPYGGDLEPPSSRRLLAELHLEPQGYDLCVCRFEPENNPLTVVRGHARLESPLPLIMVGGAP
jgi:glycosyltransferase involved in cell wall biosynthesis